MTAKRILITGASRGIGKGIALYLANLTNEDYELVLHYNKNKELAEELLNEISNLHKKASLISFDISDREQTYIGTSDPT